MPIVSGEIPYHKARALLPLVVISDDGTTVPSSRSDKYFFELQRLADEIEKGARFIAVSSRRCVVGRQHIAV